jgi:hypothetical protein
MGWKTAILNLIPKLAEIFSHVLCLGHTWPPLQHAQETLFLEAKQLSFGAEHSQTRADMPQHLGQGTEHFPAFHFMVQSDLFLFQILISSFSWRSCVILIHTVESVSLVFMTQSYPNSTFNFI